MNNDPPASFYFLLNLRNTSKKYEIFFKEISGITMEMGVEEIDEGGNNWFKHRVPTSVKYSNLVLKRGLALKDSEIVIWCMKTFNGNPEDSVKTNDIVVRLLDTDGISLKSWIFSDAYPVKWAVSDLDSDNNIVIEALEFAYSYFK